MMRRQPFTILIHIALAIILAGAIFTHFLGIRGEIYLEEGEVPTDRFVKSSGPGDGRFPFKVALRASEIDYYPGSAAPMDFRSRLVVDGKPVTVSMNNVADVDGWRFFQSGISPGASRLSVSHDPIGTGITYCGYALLFIGMIGFFFQRNTPWRSLLRRGTRMTATACLLLLPAQANAGDGLPAMQRPLAADLGKVYVYWNDRVAPLQTMARDVTLKLYGGDSYKGMTPEQVLSGWLFYHDAWERDFLAEEDTLPENPKKRKAQEERRALVYWLGTGEAFRIYPYRMDDGSTEWLSLTGRRPSAMSLEQWKFMQTTMSDIKTFLMQGRDVKVDSVIDVLIERQMRYAGAENIPSRRKIAAERLYNRWSDLLVPAILSLLSAFFRLYTAVGKSSVRLSVAADILTALVFVYVAGLLGMHWWIGGHVPLSNGPEMMLFMAFFSLLCSMIWRNPFLKGAFLLVAAMTLFVGLMGGRTPRIGMLMPVLSSPLLSVHVMLVMTSYVFFMILAILSAIALASRRETRSLELCRINRILLLPAVFLLAGGIFIGAVWANQSWGRYWGWDAKETCALVMLLIYAVPLHWASHPLRAFRRPKVLHIYLLLAVLSVAFTYFGANYLLPGLHSYA